MLDLRDNKFWKMSGTMKKSGRWSEIDVIRLAEIMNTEYEYLRKFISKGFGSSNYSR